VMLQIEARPAVGRRWRWIAAAASLLLLIGIGAMLLTDKPKQDEKMLAKTELPPPPKVSEAIPEPLETNVATVEEKPKMQQKRKTIVKPHTSRPEIPDTLGSNLWKSERNVMLALQMLSDCVETIHKSEQAARNTIVEATFKTMPEPQTVLVTNEAGDYEVVAANQQSIIEI